MERFTLEYIETCRQALAFEQSRSLVQTQQWAHVDRAQVHSDWDSLYQRMVPLIGQERPESAAVQALIGAHYAIVSRFYQPSRKAYIGMAYFYREDVGMRQFHDAYHPDLVAYLIAAMACWAEQHLSEASD